MQRDFKNFRHVKIPGEDVALFPKRAGLNTTARSAVTGIFNGLPLSQHFFNNGLGIENGRLSTSLPDDSSCVCKECVGVFSAQLNIGTRLHELHFINHIQHEVAYLIYCVGAIRFQATAINIREIGIG